jgi:hypothetical protein
MTLPRWESIWEACALAIRWVCAGVFVLCWLFVAGVYLAWHSKEIVEVGSGSDLAVRLLALLWLAVGGFGVSRILRK